VYLCPSLAERGVLDLSVSQAGRLLPSMLSCKTHATSQGSQRRRLSNAPARRLSHHGEKAADVRKQADEATRKGRNTISLGAAHVACVRALDESLRLGRRRPWCAPKDAYLNFMPSTTIIKSRYFYYASTWETAGCGKKNLEVRDLSVNNATYTRVAVES